MKKIIVTQNLDLYPDQIERLNKLGKCTFFNNLSNTYDEWLERVKDADIICSGKFGLKQKIYELKDKFISVPFVGTGWLDLSKLKDRNIVVARSPGCNRYAVSEWIIGMMINLFREFPKYINTTDIDVKEGAPRTKGLHDKTVCILGKGNVGLRVGTVCKAFEMNIIYFKRGDNLIEITKNVDIVIDCLSHNLTTEGILNKNFFMSLKKGTFFITVTGTKIYDTNAILEALDKKVLSGVAMDAGSIQVGNVNDPYYKKLQKHPKILVTPHIAYNTDVTARVGNDMMIDNIEAWLKSKPINLVE